MRAERYLRETIELARRHSKAGQGGPFGALIVKSGTILGRGWNQVIARNDPTSHAEIVAIRASCRKLGSFILRGCTLYTSCEPCPMCLAAAYWARVDRVIYAAGRADAAEIGFDDAFLYKEMPLPPADRKLPMRQKLRDEAVAVMHAWLSFPKHRHY
jgi:guanine deaminase